MKSLLRLEELGSFLFSVFLFSALPFPWWCFPLLLFAPDISIAGYLAGPRVGAPCSTRTAFHLRPAGNQPPPRPRRPEARARRTSSALSMVSRAGPTVSCLKRAPNYRGGGGPRSFEWKLHEKVQLG